MLNVSNLNSIQSNAGLNLGGVFSVSGFSNMMIPMLFGIGGIIFLLNIISSGFKLMVSKGDPKNIQAAQAKLTNSAIGIFIMMVSYWIVKSIGLFLGIDVFKTLF